MVELSAFLERTSHLHQHLCPRQVLGVRMGMLAADLLDLDLPQPDKRLYTFVETDGCFADGVSASTGCTLGHRTMRLMDYGKVAATFVDTETGNACRIFPHPASRHVAEQWVPQAESKWNAMLLAYQEMPVEKLFCWTPVQLNIDLRALISRPGIRVNCAVCGEEILNEREILRDGQPLCRSCSGDAYYHRLEAVRLKNAHVHP